MDEYYKDCHARSTWTSDADRLTHVNVNTRQSQMQTALQGQRLRDGLVMAPVANGGSLGTREDVFTEKTSTKPTNVKYPLRYYVRARTGEEMRMLERVTEI
jgi:hypothetical protein